MTHPTPIVQKFWQHVSVKNIHDPDSCWIWQGDTRLNHGGVRYGRLITGSRANRRRIAAHRFAYELIVGPIPKELILDHLCRTTLCVNPAHLEPVPHKINVLRGVGPTAMNAKKTHCLHGHPFSDENTKVRVNGWRRCRTCRRIQDHRGPRGRGTPPHPQGGRAHFRPSPGAKQRPDGQSKTICRNPAGTRRKPATIGHVIMAAMSPGQATAIMAGLLMYALASYAGTKRS